jgi:hypothetical protein
MANIARFVIVVPSCLPCGAGLRKKTSFQKIEFLRAKYELFFYFALIDPLLEIQEHRSCATHERQRLHGFLPQLDEIYFTTADKKILENCRCIVPNFMNDSFI